MKRSAILVLSMLMIAASTAAGQTLNDYDKPFAFAYGAFKGSTVTDGVAHLTGEHGRSGAGHTRPFDATAFADRTPVLHLKLGPNNKAAQLRLVLDDGEKNKRVFTYDLADANVEVFTTIYPEHGLPISPHTLDEPNPAFDAADITVNHLQGDWENALVDVYVEKITLEPVPDRLKPAQRAYLQTLRAQVEQDAAERRAVEQRKQALLRGDIERSPDGPRVVRVAPVTTDMLGLYLEELTFTPATQTQYTPQPGDQIEVSDKRKKLAWQDGKPAWAGGRSLLRHAEGQARPRAVGTLVDRDRVLAREARAGGVRLERLTADEPAAYRISSSDDPRYARPVQPLKVHRKSQPKASSDGGPLVEHAIYLQLPHPLEPGASYRIGLPGLNTAVDHVIYSHDPTRRRTEALHVSHVGFHPDDPFKRAFLSLWLGDGGAMAYHQPTFEIRDRRSGRLVYTGRIAAALDAGDPENLSGRVNRTATNVYHLDFHDFREPGEYVICLPNVGTSYPFRIAEDVWATALKVSMHGLLAHRSGIALDESFTDYARPRPMHPADGFVVLQTDITVHEGESDAIRESLTRLLGDDLDASRLERLPQAWGGYMDAGDWDRRAKHLEPTMLLMEAFEAKPEKLAAVKLALPPAEAGNAIPDLLDEALWNVMFFQRLQRPDGAVRGGIESTSHPRGGEASWQESLLVAAFAVDPLTTYHYAAAAARAARLLGPYDQVRADELHAGARSAWAWAERQGDASLAAMAERDAETAEKARKGMPALRALAALELYRLTPETKYHQAFIESTALRRGGDPTGQLASLFAYARMPAEHADAVLQAEARDVIVKAADQALRFQQGNAFGITMRVRLPLMGWVGYYTTPETIVGQVLTRAHALTGDSRYLSGAIAAVQFTLGANPMNHTMTTGLGHDFPRYPLHVDSRNAGLPVPAGITVYGNTDPARAPGWVKRWLIGPHLHPGPDRWPAAEFYLDLGNWPEMNEYTIHQSIGPTAYYWAYLHAASR